VNHLVIRVLRVCLVVLFLGSVLAQVLLPAFAADRAQVFSEVEPLVVPYSVVGILVIICAQVTLLAVWRLLSMVSGRLIFSLRAVRWVDVIATCGAIATVLSAGVLTHLLAVAGGGPGIILGLVGTVACGMTFVLLVIVMRGLLVEVNADRAGTGKHRQGV
jgi:hypothetical protein